MHAINTKIIAVSSLKFNESLYPKIAKKLDIESTATLKALTL